MSFGKGSGEDAANAIAAANLKGIEELRRQFDKAEQNVNPFIEAGTEALPGVQEGSTLQGFTDKLKSIFSGESLAPLEDERTRAIQGQLSAGGLTRSGAGLREIAKIPTDLGLALENLLFGRQANLAGQGLNASLNLGNLGANSARGVADLFSQTGQARAEGITQDAQSQAAGITQIGGTLASAIPTIASFAAGGAGAASGSSALAAAIPVVASFFSDPNLKQNVEEIGGINGLKVYGWDWIPEAEDTIVSAYPKIGFMSDEVKERYPQYVHEYAGFDTVDYRSLLDELESEILEAA